MVFRSVLCVVFVGAIIGTSGCDGGGASSDEPPAAPSSVQATSQDGAVGLTWAESERASGYNVYRATSSGASVNGEPVNGATLVEQTSFTDQSVENGTRYYYGVTAVENGSESAPSDEVSARPFPDPPDRPE